MTENDKAEPTQQPGVRSLRENLDLAMRDETIRKSISVVLRVSGGLPAQAYVFDFRAAGDGQFHCELHCKLSGRQGRASSATLADRDFLTLLKTLQRTQLLQVPQQPPGFLPDTVVGYLEISDGTSVYKTYFAADAEQAKAQQRVPPPELRQAVDAMYALGGKLMGKRSVKP